MQCSMYYAQKNAETYDRQTTDSDLTERIIAILKEYDLAYDNNSG